MTDRREPERRLKRIAGAYLLCRLLSWGLAERTLVAGTGPRRRALVRWSLWVRHPTDSALSA